MSGPSSCPGLSEAARTFCHTCHHVDAWIGLPRSERKMRPSGPAPKRATCSRSIATSSGGAGMRRDGLRALLFGRPLVRPFRPRCSWVWPSSVYARPAVVLASAMVSHPHPSSGSSHALSVSAATSEGRIIEKYMQP